MLSSLLSSMEVDYMEADRTGWIEDAGSDSDELFLFEEAHFNGVPGDRPVNPMARQLDQACRHMWERSAHDAGSSPVVASYEQQQYMQQQRRKHGESVMSRSLERLYKRPRLASLDTGTSSLYLLPPTATNDGLVSHDGDPCSPGRGVPHSPRLASSIANSTASSPLFSAAATPPWSFAPISLYKSPALPSMSYKDPTVPADVFGLDRDTSMDVMDYPHSPPNMTSFPSASRFSVSGSQAASPRRTSSIDLTHPFSGPLSNTSSFHTPPKFPDSFLQASSSPHLARFGGPSTSKCTTSPLAIRTIRRSRHNACGLPIPPDFTPHSPPINLDTHPLCTARHETLSPLRDSIRNFVLKDS
eukprot:GILJ01004799.1.p1 GENE.GILJ01004799.1~~GILJ01004799.1.p1  ORF type:complete len:358 (+),score=42.73 GILJ01004799.1:141-1214(+)